MHYEKHICQFWYSFTHFLHVHVQNLVAENESQCLSWLLGDFILHGTDVNEEKNSPSTFISFPLKPDSPDCYKFTLARYFAMPFPLQEGGTSVWYKSMIPSDSHS